MDYLSQISEKIVTRDEILPHLARYRFLQKKVVFTNGCFDLLHRGHVEYLAKAASLGDVLVVGLNTDASVSRLKGPNRPVQDQTTRALVMAALGFVAHVVHFDEDTPYELIRLVQPDFLVKGADYKAQDIVGYDIVTARGGQVVTVDLTTGFSTTNIIRKMNS